MAVLVLSVNCAFNSIQRLSPLLSGLGLVSFACRQLFQLVGISFFTLLLDPNMAYSTKLSPNACFSVSWSIKSNESKLRTKLLLGSPMSFGFSFPPALTSCNSLGTLVCIALGTSVFEDFWMWKSERYYSAGRGSHSE